MADGEKVFAMRDLRLSSFSLISSHTHLHMCIPVILQLSLLHSLSRDYDTKRLLDFLSTMKFFSPKEFPSI